MSDDLQQKKKILSSDRYIQYPPKNLLKILVIGDSNTGKTTFLDKLCNDSFEEEKIKKTYGCDLHLYQYYSDYNKLLSEEGKLKNKYISQKNEDDPQKFVEFWDISGDKNSRPFITVYTMRQLQ